MGINAGIAQPTIRAGIVNITNPDEDLRRLNTKDFYKKAQSGDYTRTESNWYDTRINSLNDFVEHYSEINPLASETDFAVDYAGEYKKYLKMRGCGSEAELQALNKTTCFTVDDLKIEAYSKLRLIFADMGNEGLIDDSYDIDNAIDYIIKNCSTTELVDCIVNPQIPPELRTTSQRSMFCHNLLKYLISKLPKDPKGKFDPEKLCNMIDKMMEVLKKRAEKELEELYASQEPDKQSAMSQGQLGEVFNKADNEKKILAYEDSFALV